MINQNNVTTKLNDFLKYNNESLRKINTFNNVLTCQKTIPIIQKKIFKNVRCFVIILTECSKYLAGYSFIARYFVHFTAINMYYSYYY